jgi:hypothetical protein
VIRVVLPRHLRVLAGVTGELVLEVGDCATIGRVIDAIEVEAPQLRGTIRNPATGRRRPFVRFFALESDLSNDGMEASLPSAVLSGAEPLYVVGAMAGG